jgi:hypothetical protein
VLTGAPRKRPDSTISTVIDSALFHVFGDEDRIRYEAGLRQVIPAGGRYLMLCFSDAVPLASGRAGCAGTRS